MKKGNTSTDNEAFMKRFEALCDDFAFEDIDGEELKKQVVQCIDNYM